MLCVGVQGQGCDAAPVFVVTDYAGHVQRAHVPPQFRPVLQGGKTPPGTVRQEPPAGDKSLPEKKKQENGKRPVQIVFQRKRQGRAVPAFLRDGVKLGAGHAFIQGRDKKAGVRAVSIRHPGNTPGVQGQFPPGQQAGRGHHLRHSAPCGLSIRADKPCVHHAPERGNRSGTADGPDDIARLAAHGAQGGKDPTGEGMRRMSMMEGRRVQKKRSICSALKIPSAGAGPAGIIHPVRREPQACALLRRACSGCIR